MIKFNFDEVEKELNKAIKKSDKAITKHLKEIGAFTIANTKKLTPVDTGHLRNSWATSEVKKSAKTFSIEVYSYVDYSIYVEYGSKGRRGKFMLKKSIDYAEKKYDGVTANIFKEILGGFKQ